MGRTPYYSLAPSHAHRWLNCSVSPRLRASVQDTGSKDATEGTLAHSLAETYLRADTAEMDTSEAFNKVRTLRADKLHTPELERNVIAYVDFVTEEHKHMLSTEPATQLLVEHKVSMDPFIPKTNGYLDSVILSDRVAKIIDLKFGHTRVDAENNPQGMSYALGLLLDAQFGDRIEYVEFVIMQPRLNHLSTATYSRRQIMSWARDYVKPRALSAKAGGTVARAGSWCKYCPVAGSCAAQAEASLDEVRALIPDTKPELLTAQQVASIVAKVEHSQQWLKDANKFLYAQLQRGEKTREYKLVKGRSNRKWLNDKDVIKRLRALKFKKGDYINEKLAGIKQVTDLLGVDELDTQLGDLIHRPEGKPVLAPADDDREVYGLNIALESFDIIRD